VNLVKSAPLNERRDWTLWFNHQVYQAALRRFDELNDNSPIWAGVSALLRDMDEILSWLDEN